MKLIDLLKKMDETLLIQLEINDGEFLEYTSCLVPWIYTNYEVVGISSPVGENAKAKIRIILDLKFF